MEPDILYNRVRRLCNILGVIFILHGIALILYNFFINSEFAMLNEYSVYLKVLNIGLVCLVFGILSLLIKHRGMLLISSLMFLLFAGIHAVVARNYFIKFGGGYNLPRDLSVAITLLYSLLGWLSLRGYIKTAGAIQQVKEKPAKKVKTAKKIITAKKGKVAKKEERIEKEKVIGEEAVVEKEAVIIEEAVVGKVSDQFTWDISVSIK